MLIPSPFKGKQKQVVSPTHLPMNTLQPFATTPTNTAPKVISTFVFKVGYSSDILSFTVADSAH